MKVVEKKGGATERRILTAMIVDKLVLARIAAKWTKEGLFKSPWANTVATWCVRYFRKHERAPASDIESIFEAWASNNSKDKDTIKLVETLLSTMSGEYKTLRRNSNSDYITDLAGEYFNRVALERFRDTIDDHLNHDEVSKAFEKASSFNKIEMGMGSVIDVLEDKNALKEAFQEHREPLIVYPGALGKFFGDALQRDSFISVLAPEKRGKSFCLIDLAWMGMEQRRKVAFFAVGDMSQNQMMRRLAIRASRRPLRRTYDRPVLYPQSITKARDEKFATVEHIERHFKKPLTWKMAWDAFNEVRIDTKSNTPLFKMSVHPSNSINVHGIASTLQSWAYEGWTPDVVVIDYADILAPLSHRSEVRDQINETWASLRGLSQSLHACVITATQANAASYKAEIIDQSNFSEDKRKFAHVTGMFALNRNTEEKEQGIMRLNWVVLREDEFIDTKCVHVAGCLAVARPFIRSTF